MSKLKLPVGTFEKLCKYVESNSTERLLQNSFQLYLQNHHISIPVNDIPKRRACYEDWLDRAFLGKFISQYVGGHGCPTALPISRTTWMNTSG